MKKFFKLKENGTTVSTEIMAGFTTFFAMSYILFVNPSILSLSGMPFQAVFLATILSSAIGTLVMGLFANVPYAQAPGMGLNAFFTFTVVFGLGYSWEQALAMVFLCGMINIVITVTKLRKLIIKSIPESLQHAIGGGIGIFVAYVGIKNAGLLQFTSDSSAIISSTVEDGAATNVVSNGGIVPALANFNNPAILLAVIGLVLTAILVVKNVKGAILIGIVATTIIAIPMGVVDLSAIDFHQNSLGNSFKELGTTFGAAFGPLIILSLFWKRMTLNGAIAGVIVGAVTVIVWKNTLAASTGLYEIMPGFVLSFISIVVVTLLGKAPEKDVVDRFEHADRIYKDEMQNMK